MLLVSLRRLIEKETGETDFSLDEAELNGRGDFSTNVAFLLAKSASTADVPKRRKVSPMTVAEDLKERFLKGASASFFEKAEVAAPGFINFWVSKKAVEDELVDITGGKNRVGLNEFSGKKVMVEYTDPNPFKQFHIGHLMTNTIGESIARLCEAAGAEVTRVNYQGDVGLHVALSIWGIMKINDEMPDESATLADKTKFLGRAYALGATGYKEDAEAKVEIEGLNKKIYERTDEEINKIYDLGRKWSLDYFENLYKRLDTKFIHYFFESEVGSYGVEIVKAHPEVFIKSEGAIIFPGEKYGLHNRVFINSLGLPTYEAKELGLNKRKAELYNPDVSLIVTAKEINEYFHVLLKAMEFVVPEIGSKTKHIGHGMLRLPTGKMSSRTGNVITAEALLSELRDAVSVKINNREDLTDIEKEEIKERVAIAAIRYSILKQGIGKDIIFDIDTSVSFHGDSGPYLQYTYARLKSILRKARLNGGSADEAEFDAKNISMETDAKIILKLARFQEVVRRAAHASQPNYVATYLYDLAQVVNHYYEINNILQSDTSIKAVRLNLISAVAETLKNGLNLLGIKTLERM
ncbi:MAG: arginine--tRNA ligase [Candidatus Colwellbacteria bacterium]|nr:arginine--tRNA ligase [Candidatus Colwellbacteria bacterium]